jgi:hypothetical protein
MLISMSSKPRTRFLRTVTVLTSAIAGGILAAAPAYADASPGSVRITNDQDSVRITAVCDETDREHPMCTAP